MHSHQKGNIQIALIKFHRVQTGQIHRIHQFQHLCLSQKDTTGAMDFSLWREIGTDFLVKSNINNWISCSEDGGSLVTQIEGGLNCKVEKIIVPGLCEQVKPYRLAMQGGGPALYASDFYYYFETAMNTYWPVADPCGRKSTNHLEDMNDPSGWIYIRPEQTPDISIHQAFDEVDPSSE